MEIIFIAQTQCTRKVYRIICVITLNMPRSGTDMSQNFQTRRRAVHLLSKISTLC